PARRSGIRRGREVLRQSRSRRDRSGLRGPTHRGMNPKARQELVGIAALLVGFFLGLTLLPVSLTGSWGRAMGAALWQGFGIGAIVVPILGVGWALAAFDRLGALTWGRAAVLGAGLILLVPYGVAVAISPTFPPDYANWTRSERLVGLFPAFLATGLEGAIAAQIEDMGRRLVSTLETFRVGAQIINKTVGPVVTRFELEPGRGVKVGRVSSLADDLALAMRAQSLRIVAPIPGKAAIGIEVPNPTPRLVHVRDLIDSAEFRRAGRVLPVVLG